MASDPSSTTVFVTGASGYIAGHVIQQLLEAGFKVRGSVRSLANETKVKHLQDTFPGVELVEADLLVPGSFDAGIAGCEFVMHTASPFQFGLDDPQRSLVDPAVQGTNNVLEAATKAGTVKRVVVTSSCAAVSSIHPLPGGKVLSEADWNELSKLEDDPYSLSKTLAEKAAWEYAKTAPYDVITINPSCVFGPALSARVDATSIKMVKALLEGGSKDGASPNPYGSVDVRDVAKAHVEAIMRKEASGRYILSSSEGLTSLLVVSNWIRECPEAAPFFDSLPTAVAGEPRKPFLYDHSKAETELGIDFTPTSKAVVDQVKHMIANGMTTPPAGK